MATLNERWLELFAGVDPAIVESAWDTIIKKYGEAGRYYHTLRHLEQLFLYFDFHKHNLVSPLTIALAIFYHDIYYIAGNPDNEARSAEMAADALKKLRTDVATIKRVKELILATKDHLAVKSPDQDLAFFLDIDLSILGAPTEVYKLYASSIRKEFALVPEGSYQQGRYRFLQKMLAAEHIFFTPVFQKMEAQAKANIGEELRQLRLS